MNAFPLPTPSLKKRYKIKVCIIFCTVKTEEIKGNEYLPKTLNIYKCLFFCITMLELFGISNFNYFILE